MLILETFLGRITSLPKVGGMYVAQILWSYDSDSHGDGKWEYFWNW